MWLARCWGQAVSSVAELEVGGGGKKLGGRGERERERERELDLTEPGSRVSGLGSVA